MKNKVVFRFTYLLVPKFLDQVVYCLYFYTINAFLYICVYILLYNDCYNQKMMSGLFILKMS